MNWWNKLFKKKVKSKKVDVLNDLEAVKDFLTSLSRDVKPLLIEIKKLEELEKEYSVAESGIIQVNLETQAKILDKLLQHYEFFQSDADINGLRVKMVTKEFLKRASQHGLKDLVKEKKKNRVWLLHW